MTSEPLQGFVFVFTGDMSIDREEAKSKVLLLGGRVTTAVSSKTTHLVAGIEPGPSKMEKAGILRTKILNEDQFKELIDKYSSKMNKEIKTTVNKAKETESKEDDSNKKPWVEKYRPKRIEEIVGNKAAIEQLQQFINNETKFKAALLSGSPGVGKTTAAIAVCKENGIVPIEFNASDLRSKKMLNDKISKSTENMSFGNDLRGGKRVIIMDEVDGMTSDRGGIPELVNIIKNTKTPIICICNDKTHPKMRTLASHCLDIHFRKMDNRSILPRIKFILEKENKALPDGVINDVITTSNGDIRYVLNTLQSLLSKSVINLDYINNMLTKKNVLKGTFEIASELFQRKSIVDKIDLYFEDNSLMPLFVQENYLKCNFNNNKELLISAESISQSDIYDARIHGTEQEWSLMPYHAFFSCVLPVFNRALHKRLDFPLFLGQNSKQSKNNRILSEIVHHLRVKSTRKGFRLYAAEILFKKFIDELKNGEIEKAVNILEEYELEKEDIINLGDLIGSELYKSVSAKYKTAFTREYNKLGRVLRYSKVTEDEEFSEEE